MLRWIASVHICLSFWEITESQISRGSSYTRDILPETVAVENGDIYKDRQISRESSYRGEEEIITTIDGDVPLTRESSYHEKTEDVEAVVEGEIESEEVTFEPVESFEELEQELIPEIEKPSPPPRPENLTISRSVSYSYNFTKQ